MKYNIKRSGRFNKDYKLSKKRGLDITLLKDVIYKLGNGVQLDKKHKDHALKGKWNGFRECHIQPDWILVYLVEDDILTLTLTGMGTHSDLFQE